MSPKNSPCAASFPNFFAAIDASFKQSGKKPFCAISSILPCKFHLVAPLSRQICSNVLRKAIAHILLSMLRTFNAASYARRTSDGNAWLSNVVLGYKQTSSIICPSGLPVSGLCASLKSFQLVSYNVGLWQTGHSSKKKVVCSLLSSWPKIERVTSYCPFCIMSVWFPQLKHIIGSSVITFPSSVVMRVFPLSLNFSELYHPASKFAIAYPIFPSSFSSAPARGGCAGHQKHQYNCQKAPCIFAKCMLYL